MRRKRKRSRYSSGLSFYEDKNTVNTSRIAEALLWVSYTVIALFLAVICFRSFGFRIGVLGGSMEPGIIQGQNVLVNKLAYRMSTPQRGDVVAFYPGGDDKMHPSVKRVVAIPGDSVQILNGVLLVNGIPCSYSDGYSSISEAGLAADMEILEDSQYFVMGDNPEDSEDSRSAGIGTVQDEDIIGSVWLALPADGSRLHRVE